MMDLAMAEKIVVRRLRHGLARGTVDCNGPLRNFLLGAAVAAVAMPMAPLAAQSSLSQDDPPLQSAGFLSIPQVNGRGYILDGSLTTRFDSNFRRAGGTGSNSAVRLSPLVDAGIGTLLGRQQVYVGGSVGRDIFLGNSEFNQNRYSIGAGANLVAGTRCTANVGSQFSQRQLLLADAVELADNALRDFVAGAGFSCQGPVGVGFGATAVYRQSRNARLERQLFDVNNLTISPQISYASPVLGVFSLGGSFSKIRYPQRSVFTPEGLVQDGIDIRSGRIGFSRALGTRLQLSLGASLIDVKPQPPLQLVPGPLPGTAVSIERDGFNGGGFDASLTARLGSRATISASAESSVRGGGNVGALLTRSKTYGVDANYRLSKALSAGVGGSIGDLRYIGSFASADEPIRRESDNIKRVYGQVNYSPSPRYSVGVEVAHQQRESNPDIFKFSNTSALLRLSVQLGRS